MEITELQSKKITGFRVLGETGIVRLEFENSVEAYFRLLTASETEIIDKIVKKFKIHRRTDNATKK